MGEASGSVVFLVDFFLELGDSLVLSVADSLFGDFSVLASVFFVVLLVESALLFFSLLVEVSVDGLLVVFSAAGLFVVAGTEALVEGFAVEVGGWTGAVAAGEATGFAVAVTPGVMVAAGVALAATLAVAAGVALGAAVAFVDALVLVVVVGAVVVVPVVFVTPMLKLGVTP
ncbi:MAG: hypothetical protein V7609_3406 [Verrucomicrobiota bacterium]